MQDDIAPEALDDLAGLYEGLTPGMKTALYGRGVLERFRQRALPRAIYLELTSACNLNCVMCPTQRTVVKKHKPDGFMDPALFERLVDEIAAFDRTTKVVLHKDGEPMLHPQIVEMATYAARKLDNVLLVTNGTLMTEDKARGLLESGIGSVRFSVDGLSRQTFEKIRRQDPANVYADPLVPVDYESVLANIRRFCAMKKERGVTRPNVGVRITDFEATRKELADYKQYWEQHVDFVEVARLLSWSGQVTSESSDAASRYPCMALWSQAVVNWDGRLAACCVYVDTTGDGKGIVGDVRATSLREAYFGSAIQRLRLAHLNNDLTTVAPFCTPCRDWRSPVSVGERVWTDGLRSEMRAEIEAPAGSERLA
jgi:MoaA/NifB/PqqE/SkfB family radical SAM enzyme